MSEPERRRTALFALLAAVLAGVALAAAGPVAAQETPAANNTTVQHERPDALQEDGDTGQVAAWLEGQMAGRLADSSIALSEGEYEQAKSVIGPEYRERFGQYVDVAGETDERNDSSEAFQQTRESQRGLANETQQYEQTYEQYEQARANGNASGARAHAREMEQLAQGVERNGENVTGGLATLESQTGTDTDDSRARIDALVENVSSRQATVRAETFAETELTMSEPTGPVSFSSPLELDGRLTTANGSAVADRTVTVAVAGTPHRVTTDADGTFSLSHRPTSLPLDADAVTVAFRPAETSPYLPSETEVPVDVEQERPTVTVLNATETVRYGDDVAVDAGLAVDGIPVRNASLRASIDGQALATAQTGEAGVVTLIGSLPASVPAGDREVRVALPYRDRALAPANATATVTVASTPTNLTAEPVDGGENATLAGRLTTADGRPVPGQLVTVRRDGTVIESTQTGDDGTYRTTVPISADAGDGNGTVAVTVRFSGEGTNLDPSTATAAIAVEGGSGQPAPAGGGPIESAESLWPFGDTVPLWAAAVAAVAGTLLTVVWWRSRGATGDEAGSSAPSSTSAETPTQAEESDPFAESVLTQAETFLEQGAAAASARASYAAVRDVYAGETDPRTHWELLDRSESLSPAEREALWLVVTAYEEAAFSTATVDEERARSALGAARDVVE